MRRRYRRKHPPIILIVEPDRFWRSDLREALTGDGFLCCVSSLKEAMRYFRKHRREIEVILIDYHIGESWRASELAEFPGAIIANVPTSAEAERSELSGISDIADALLTKQASARLVDSYMKAGQALLDNHQGGYDRLEERLVELMEAGKTLHEAVLELYARSRHGLPIIKGMA